MTDTTTARIESWDWRYRVAFDRSVRTEVERIIAQHADPDERKLLEELLAWSREFVSLDAVLAVLANQFSDSLEVFDSLDESKLLHIPGTLKRHFEKKISSAAQSSESERYLSHLLHVSLGAAYRPLHHDLFRIVFGDSVRELLELPKEEAVLKPLPTSTRPRVKKNEIVDFVEIFKARVLADPAVREFLGDLEMPEFKISVQEGLGFAEYWPKEILPPSDLLIVFENEDSMVPETLDLTLIHEVAPGHGYYYYRLRNSTGPLVDYGALILTEGWATWCEWNIFKGPFSDCARAARLHGLKFFEHPVVGLAEDYLEYVRQQGYSLRTARDATVYFFQYPGFGFSYTLGALWFERCFPRRLPREFFEFLDRRSWGDFFKLWNI